MDIGRVFSISFAMFRQRFWLLLGMWLVFLVIQFAAAIAIFVGVIGMGLAGAAGLAGGLEDPAAFTGLGIGMIAAVVLFYAGYIVILLAQQAAMVTIASPLEEPSFGGAMVAVGLPVVLLIAAADAAEGGSGAGAVLAIIGGLLIIPVMIVYTLFAAAFAASLHSEVTGGGSDRLEEVFA